MKKWLLIVVVFVFGVLISGCSNSNKPTPEEKQLDLLLADVNYNTHIYNKACFKVYKKGTEWYDSEYNYVYKNCYMINTSQFSDTEDPTDILLYSQKVDGVARFSGYLLTDLSLQKTTQYGFSVYNGSELSLTPLLPVCHVNDTENDSFCIDTYWVIKDGITVNDSIVILDE